MADLVGLLFLQLKHEYYTFLQHNSVSTNINEIQGYAMFASTQQGAERRKEVTVVGRRGRYKVVGEQHGGLSMPVLDSSLK